MLWDPFRRLLIRRRLARSTLGRQLLDRADREGVKIQLAVLRPEIVGTYDEAVNAVCLNRKLEDERLVRALAHELRHHEQKVLGLFALRDALAPLDAGIARRICEADAKAVEVAVCAELAGSDPALLESLTHSWFDLAQHARQCVGRPAHDTVRTIFAHVADPEDWRAHYDLAEAENRLSGETAAWPTAAPIPLSAFLEKVEELSQGRPHASANELVAAVMRDDDQSDGRVLLLALEHSAYGTVRSSVSARDLHIEVSDALRAFAETVLAQRRDLHRENASLAKQAQAFAAGIKLTAPGRDETGYRALSDRLEIGLSLAVRIRQLWYDRSSPELYGKVDAHHQTLDRMKSPFERQLTAVSVASGLLAKQHTAWRKELPHVGGRGSSFDTKDESR